MDQASAIEILRKTGWLAGEAESVARAVLNASKLRYFKAGETAFQSGDDPGGIYGIADGGFGIYIPSRRGELALTTIIRRGIWFGHGPVLTGKTRTMTFRALEPSHVLHLSLAAIAAIVSENPDFPRRLGALSERNYSDVALGVIGDLLIPSVEGRIAATLARISRPDAHAGADSPEPAAIRVAQAEIAQMANASRDSVNRALAKFAKAGWLSVAFKTIRVIDHAALDEFAAANENL